MTKYQLLFFTTIVLIILSLSITVLAHEGAISENVTVEVYINPVENLKSTTAVFNLYSEDNLLLATKSINVNESDKTYVLDFPVSKFSAGEKFALEIAQGLHSIISYNSIIFEGGSIILETYGYFDSSLNKPAISSHFAISGNPKTEKNIEFYINDKKVSTTNHLKLAGNYVLAQIDDLCSALGMKDAKIIENDKEEKVSIEYDDNNLTFSFISNVVDLNGEELLADVPAYWIENKIYVPVKIVSLIFAKGYEVEHLDSLTKSFTKIDPTKLNENTALLESFVNNSGVTSKTPYLIWISKATYKVNVFEKVNGKYVLLKSIPCAIGASHTPTITGQFEYFSLESRWLYPKYYVGPIMRFYNGYAIHSTLLKYDDTDYDSRVGVKISLGCIRVSPENIKWLVKYIPKQTKIYITEN